MRLWWVCLGVALVQLLGCVPREQLQREAVLQRAPFDLSCDVEQIRVLNIGENSIGAEGCGKKASYYCQGGYGGGEASCILNAVNERVYQENTSNMRK